MTHIGRNVGKCLSIAVLATALLLASVPKAAGSDWELGARLGYESNVNRSLDDAKGDTALTVHG